MYVECVREAFALLVGAHIVNVSASDSGAHRQLLGYNKNRVVFHIVYSPVI